MSFKGYIKENLPWIRSIYRKRLAPINLIHNIFDKPVVVLLYHRVNHLNRDLFNISNSIDSRRFLFSNKTVSNRSHQNSLPVSTPPDVIKIVAGT